jgi:RNA polymerase sigma-70 factor, ECF subfamily
MIDDRVLLQDIRRMDAGALAQAFDLYASAIYKYAYRHAGDAILADQIAGDVFARLIEQLSLGLGPRANLRSYLFEVAYHLVVDQVRYSQKVLPIRLVEFTLPAANLTDLVVERQMQWESVWRAIRDDLTEYQRHVVILRFMEGFSLKETARILGKTVGSIKVAQNRAVAIIRKALEEQETNRKLETENTSSGPPV